MLLQYNFINFSLTINLRSVILFLDKIEFTPPPAQRDISHIANYFYSTPYYHAF